MGRQMQRALVLYAAASVSVLGGTQAHLALRSCA